MMPANTPDLTQAQVQQMITDAMASGAPMVLVNQAVVEGQTVTLPNTNNDITLNLETGGASLNAVTVNLPGNTDGRVGQRVFVNADGNIALAHFQAAAGVTVNGSDYMFNPGDNCVFYRNKPAIMSRITA
jgi:hypothetical protein